MADGKWIEGLSPQMSISDAAAVTLAARFAVVRHFLPLAANKAQEDPEHVHQLRVGTRRAGAALRAFADCIPKKHLKSARKSLRVIRRAAGDARDWDVFLLALPQSKAHTGAAGRPLLDFLAGYAISARSVAQLHLVEASSQSGPAFVEESTALPALTHEPKGEKPPGNFGELAVTQFAGLLTAFDQSAAANPRDPAALHSLRILGKRVRYALEIFATALPPVFRESVYPQVEQLQELLGDIQDASVGIARLSDLQGQAQRTLPREWPRLRKGFEAQIKSLRTQIPVGRKAFQTWRRDWAKLMRGIKLEALTATVVAG